MCVCKPKIVGIFLIFHLIFETVSYTKSGFTNQPRLAGQTSPVILLSEIPSTGVTVALPLNIVGAGVQTQVPFLVLQTLPTKPPLYPLVFLLCVCVLRQGIMNCEKLEKIRLEM